MAEAGSPAPLGRTTTAVLAWLAEHGPATAAEAARACGMEGISMRGRLTMLARQGYLSSRPNDAKLPRHVYTVTAEGRRRVGAGDARFLP